eukprot:COSAG01_NODE_1466_length_10220_cov_15.883608_15_plen_100_part_00
MAAGARLTASTAAGGCCAVVVRSAGLPPLLLWFCVLHVLVRGCWLLRAASCSCWLACAAVRRYEWYCTTGTRYAAERTVIEYSSKAKTNVDAKQIWANF